jgi:hypothetical protein
MSVTSPSAPPSPELFFDVIQRSDDAAALKTGIELDVFTAIAEGNHSAKALAGRCRASERGMRSLCDVLVVIGFLMKNEKGYALTPDSAVFLTPSGDVYTFSEYERLLRHAGFRSATLYPVPPSPMQIVLAVK